MNSLLCEFFKKKLLLFMGISMVVFNIPILSIAESGVQPSSDPVLEQKESKEASTEIEDQVESIVDETDPGEEESDSIDGLTMLYIGGGVAGVAALAVALGSNSGSSEPDTPPPEPVPPPEPPVGPDLNGTDWAGYLDIKNNKYRGYQAVSATIIHSGRSLQINTSSTLHYGQQFSGTISSGGYIFVRDSTTGQTWTTHRGSANTRRVDLYDYVNNFKELDRMKLTR